MKQYPLPPSILIATLITMAISLAMLALAIVTFVRRNALWSNAVVACLILLHHTAYLITAYYLRSKRTAAGTSTAKHADKLLRVIDPDESEAAIPLTPGGGAPPQWSGGEGYRAAPPYYAMPLPYQKLNIAALVFLAIIATMAFGVTLDATHRAAGFGVDVDAGTMLDYRISRVQTGVLACAGVALGVHLALCAMGRGRVRRANEVQEAREFMGAENL